MISSFASQFGDVDIDNSMGSDNYQYDAIGQLISDQDEGITNIGWTVTNKVEDVSYGSDKQIHFDYNAMGNRIAKHVTAHGITQSTYYTLDAQGNQMGIYTFASDENKLYLSERDIYGSKRIGQERPDLLMELNPTVNGTSYSANNVINDKRYELSNHLGNVLEVVTDHKLPIDSNSDGNVDYYLADVVSYSDYYPFGQVIPNRHGNDNQYRYGFQGQERDDEVKGAGNSVNFEFRMHDPRIGRFFAVDPLEMNFPHNSPYAFSENRVLDAFEMEGKELVLVHGTFAKRDDKDRGAFLKADYNGGSTWKKELGEGIGNATGWTKDQTYEYTWSGANKSWNRKAAAKDLAKKLMDSELNPDADKKHVTLVGHSHGGNVNKELQKILSKKGWTVDIINIETPQRQDHKPSFDAKEKGVYLNFYYTNDLIQYEGTGDNGHTPNNVGNYGERIDGQADKNICVDDVYNNSSTADWWSDSFGHSVHQNKDVIKLIVNKVTEAFKNNKVNESK